MGDFNVFLGLPVRVHPQRPPACVGLPCSECPYPCHITDFVMRQGRRVCRTCVRTEADLLQRIATSEAWEAKQKGSGNAVKKDAPNWFAFTRDECEAALSHIHPPGTRQVSESHIIETHDLRLEACNNSFVLMQQGDTFTAVDPSGGGVNSDYYVYSMTNNVVCGIETRKQTELPHLNLPPPYFGMRVKVCNNTIAEWEALRRAINEAALD